MTIMDIVSRVRADIIKERKGGGDGRVLTNEEALILCDELAMILQMPEVDERLDGLVRLASATADEDDGIGPGLTYKLCDAINALRARQTKPTLREYLHEGDDQWAAQCDCPSASAYLNANGEYYWNVVGGGKQIECGVEPTFEGAVKRARSVVRSAATARGMRVEVNRDIVIDTEKEESDAP